MSFSPDALPASQVKGHTVDYNTYEELHFSWTILEETILSVEGGHFWLVVITLSGYQQNPGTRKALVPAKFWCHHSSGTSILLMSALFWC
jgi:hypothetical protein